MKQRKNPQKPVRCICEDPGHFRSGVPGILAHIEKDQIIGKVERCDACRRFHDDEVAEWVLRKLIARHASRPRGRVKCHQLTRR